MKLKFNKFQNFCLILSGLGSIASIVFMWFNPDLSMYLILGSFSFAMMQISDSQSLRIIELEEELETYKNNATK